MCIRDRREIGLVVIEHAGRLPCRHAMALQAILVHRALMEVCLLYTSDAADERSSVDLGGRRIIKKKNTLRLAR